MIKSYGFKEEYLCKSVAEKEEFSILKAMQGKGWTWEDMNAFEEEFKDNLNKVLDGLRGDVV